MPKELELIFGVPWGQGKAKGHIRPEASRFSTPCWLIISVSYAGKMVIIRELMGLDGT